MSESSSPKTVTREQLHEQVWSEPATKIASGYGVSDVAIAQACKRLNVPRPPRGYWAKLEAGKRVKRPKLPPIVEGAPTSTVIDSSRSTSFPKSLIPDTAVLPKVEVPEDLRGCHPLISTTRKAIESGRAREDHLVKTTASGMLDVVVSKSGLHRALRLMEALIHGCEARGWKVMSKGDGRATQIVLSEDPVSLTLSEKVDRAEIEPPPEQKGQWYFKRYTYTPTGRLSIQIMDYLGNGQRSKWGDGKVQRLEDMLPDILVGIELASEQLHARRLEHAERERRWAEERRRREELAKRIKVEKERRAQLEAEAIAWQRATAIRRLCDELETQAKTAPGRFAPEDTKRWLEWARVIAAKGDPFDNGHLAQAVQQVGLDADLDCSREISYW